MLLFFQVRPPPEPSVLLVAVLCPLVANRCAGAVAAQNSVALVCLFAAKKAVPNTVKFRKRLKWNVAMDWLPVNLLFCAMLMTGFLSLKALAVPMVTIFKNLTNVVILAGDWYFHGATISTG